MDNEKKKTPKRGQSQGAVTASRNGDNSISGNKHTTGKIEGQVSVTDFLNEEKQDKVKVTIPIEKAEPKPTGERPSLCSLCFRSYDCLNGKYNGKCMDSFHVFKKDEAYPSKVVQERVFTDVVEHFDFFVLGGETYSYEEGAYYLDDDGTCVKDEISRRIFPDIIDSTDVNKIYNRTRQTKSLRITPYDVNRQPYYYICFKNGYWDVKNHILLPHNPSDHCMNVVPHVFDPKAKPTGKYFDDWLKTVAPNEDEQQMILQWFGHNLMPDDGPQKYMCFCGDGGSGKSLMVEILHALVGEKNISHASMHDLSTNRFASADLRFMLANIDSDMRIEDYRETDIFRKATSGDRTRTEQKNAKKVDIIPYARMTFCTNPLPRFVDAESRAIFRRTLVHPMGKLPPKVIQHFDDVIIKSDLEYILYRSVEAVSQMLEQGYFTESEASKEATVEIRKGSDSVFAFLDEKCELEESSFIGKQTVYEAYATYCKEQGFTALGQYKFFESLRLKGYRDSKKNNANCFLGFTLKADAS